VGFVANYNAALADQLNLLIDSEEDSEYYHRGCYSGCTVLLLFCSLLHYRPVMSGFLSTWVGLLSNKVGLLLNGMGLFSRGDY